MKGILNKNEDGIWKVKWSDLHSFAHGTHWMYTELSPYSNSIRYIKDNLIMCKPLEEGLEVEFEMFTTGYNGLRYETCRCRTFQIMHRLITACFIPCVIAS